MKNWIAKILELFLKTEFMLANQILREEEEKLQILKNRKFGYEESVRQLLRHNLDVDRIKENQEAVVRMGEFITVQKERVKEAMRQVEIKAAKLTELMQERKAQEKLKEADKALRPMPYKVGINAVRKFMFRKAK